MKDMNGSKTDLVERAVTEATGSKAAGRFAKLTFEAMNLQAGLSREQTPICDAVLSTGRQANVRKTAVWLEGWPG